MTKNIVTTLCDISAKPNASASTCLIATRRICRALSLRLATIQAERRALYRQASKLRRSLPFTASAVDRVEHQAGNHRDEELRRLREVLSGFGRALISERGAAAAELGFDRLCDLLCINTTDREQARQNSDHSLSSLVYVDRLEDSADRQSDIWGAGGPLYQACFLAMIEFIKECPEHLLPDPFAPGAPFGPKLPPTLRIVGP